MIAALFVLGALQAAGIDQRVGEPISFDAVLRDEAGDPVTLREAAAGKVVILALVYYRCPMLCNLVIGGLFDALQDLELSAGEQFTVLAVSFDPSDAPTQSRARKTQALKSYGRPSAGKGCRFLTGDADAIDRLCRETGFRTTFDPVTRQYAHGSALILLTPQGKISRYLFGISYPVRELKLSLIEAASGAVGSRTDQLLLMCMQYDPATGKYGLAVMRLLKVFALATLAGAGFLVWRLSRGTRGAV